MAETTERHFTIEQILALMDRKLLTSEQGKEMLGLAVAEPILFYGRPVTQGRLDHFMICNESMTNCILAMLEKFGKDAEKIVSEIYKSVGARFWLSDNTTLPR